MNYFLKDTAAHTHIHALFMKNHARVSIVIYYFFILSKTRLFLICTCNLCTICVYALRFYNSRRRFWGKINYTVLV